MQPKGLGLLHCGKSPEKSQGTTLSTEPGRDQGHCWVLLQIPPQFPLKKERKGYGKLSQVYMASLCLRSLSGGIHGEPFSLDILGFKCSSKNRIGLKRSARCRMRECQEKWLLSNECRYNHDQLNLWALCFHFEGTHCQIHKMPPESSAPTIKMHWSLLNSFEDWY